LLSFLNEGAKLLHTPVRCKPKWPAYIQTPSLAPKKANYGQFLRCWGGKKPPALTAENQVRADLVADNNGSGEKLFLRFVSSRQMPAFSTGLQMYS
jgi:hypothetical protein